MIKSMTGFGRGKNSNNEQCFEVEIKTFNNRYKDIFIRMPKHLSYLEENINKSINERISRGRVEVYISLEYIDSLAMDVNIDIPLAKSYKKGLETLIEELHILDDIKLSHILDMSDVIKTERRELDENLAWTCLEVALDQALEDVLEMRKNEGFNLKNDIENQLKEIEELIEKIKKRSPLLVAEYKMKLEERIKEILDLESNIDEEKLESEVVFFANRSDINEEIIRLESHVKQFYESLKSKEAIGRKLDFLVQEMNREINTIGSKGNDLEISSYVVDVKSSLEKIREQAQNVE